ncbi:hypothetical protein [Streptomyces sp.]|uniref:hypothetical protein n=1 Tax=Streptomyces sp. TaxID=1931 RepID=UPI0035BF84EF
MSEVILRHHVGSLREKASSVIAGVPCDHTPAMIRHPLALVATVATTDEAPACFTRPRGGLRRG